LFKYLIVIDYFFLEIAFLMFLGDVSLGASLAPKANALLAFAAEFNGLFLGVLFI
jgi:hypothetical protein